MITSHKGHFFGRSKGDTRHFFFFFHNFRTSQTFLKKKFSTCSQLSKLSAPEEYNQFLADVSGALSAAGVFHFALGADYTISHLDQEHRYLNVTR